MATTEQITQIDRLVPRLLALSHNSRTRDHCDRADSMVAHLLKAKNADTDIAAQEIEHAQRIVGV